jgi:hypothetical protein
LFAIAAFLDAQQSAIAKNAIPQESTTTTTTTTTRLSDAATALLLAAILISTALFAPPVWSQESLLQPLALFAPCLPAALTLGERATGSLPSAI